MFPEKLQNLINTIHTFPTIGQKTAEKISFDLLNRSEDELKQISKTILEIKSIKLCKACFNISENDYCDICLNKNRDSSVICIVSQIKDISNIEKTCKFKGKYHVLHGLIDTLNGVTPDKIKIQELIERLTKNKEKIKEVIFGIDPKIEGESTIIYISKLLKPLNIKMTRFARGLPIGSEIEYADQITLSDSISGRIEI